MSHRGYLPALMKIPAALRGLVRVKLRPAVLVLPLALLGAAVLVASRADAQTLIQQKTASANNANTLSVTLTSAPGVNHMLVMVGAFVDACLDPTKPNSITGGGVATWTKAASSCTNSNIEIWYGISDGSSSTVTINCTSTTLCATALNVWMNVSEWSGVAGNDAAIAGSGNSGPNKTSTSATAGTITTTNANDLLIFGVAASPASDTFASPSPGTWTAMTSVSASGNVQSEWYQAVTATGAYGPSDTMSNASRVTFSWDAAIAALKVCGTVSDGSYVAANAQNGQVTVYWPSATNVVILQKTSAFATETPANGSTYTAGTTPGGTVGSATVAYVGSAGSFNQTSLTNGTTQYYKVFVQNAVNCYSPGIAINATPNAGTGAPVWSYATTAASLAPPALDPWSSKLVSGSNDNKLHAMNEANGTMAFAPFVTGGAIQSRPAMLPAGYRTPASTVNVAYVTSQDGYVYAVDTTTGAQVWKSPSLASSGMLQGGPGVWIQAIYPLPICGVTIDVVFVGTRNTGTTSANTVYALNGSATTVTSTGGGNCVASGTNVAPGAALWTFTGSSTYKMDIISSTPYVDYVNNVVWVTSRSAGGTIQGSLWQFNVTNGTVINFWALGDIDSSPTPSLSADGNFIYVGTNAGTLKALNVSTGTVTTYTPTTGTGAILSLPWSLSFRPVGSGATIANSSSRSGCPTSLPSVTAGNINVVVVALTPTTASVSSVSDGASTYVRRAAVNGPNARVEIWTATIASGASTTVTTTASGQTSWACAVSQYSGAGIGTVTTVTGSSGNPSISLTTQDSGNWVVAGFATAGTNTPTAGSGTFRQGQVVGSVGVGLVDGSSATPASVTLSETDSNSGWAATAVELRSTAPDTIIFAQGTYVQSVNWNGSTFTANWTGKQLTNTPTLSAPVDDGAGNLYIGGSDGKVHRVLVSTGADQAQVPTTAISGTFGDPTFNQDTNQITVGATDGHIYTFAVPF